MSGAKLAKLQTRVQVKLAKLKSEEHERWKCKLCGRWRFQTWWSIYQHFRKVHPQIKKKYILKNTICLP